MTGRKTLLSWLTVLFWYCFHAQTAYSISEISVVPLNHGKALLSSRDVISKIQGESLFIPDMLLSPKDLRFGIPSHQKFLPFPRPWNKIPDQEPYGGGTYVLTLQFPEQSISKGTLWGILFPRNLGPVKIWVDGQLAAERGRVVLDSKKIRYETGNLRHFFKPQQSEVQIIIQTANYHLHSGGFSWSFFVAPEDRLRAFNLELNLIDGAIGGSLAFSAIYHIWLFTFRRKWRWYLIFGIFFVAMTLRLPFTGASRWGLDFGWNELVSWKVEYITFFLMIPINFTALSWLYPRQTWALAQSVLTTLAYLSCLWVLMTPQWLSYLSVRPMQVAATITALLNIRTLTAAIRDQEAGSNSIALGFFIVMAAGAMDILASFEWINPHFSVLGPALLIFAALACIFQALQFERAYRQLEEQTDDISKLQSNLERQAEVLEESVQRKTEDLQAVLENTDECILILREVDKVLTISPFASFAAQRLFGKPVITWPDLESLFMDSQLSSDQQAQLVASLVATLGSSLLNFEINQDSFPNEIRRMAGTEIQAIYLCRWLPLEHDDEVSEILLILIDVTQERMTAQKAELARSSTERLLQIAALEPKSFGTFLREVDHLLERTRQYLSNSNQGSWGYILRDIHTIKGLTRNFGLLHLSEDVHIAESGLLSLPGDEFRMARAQVIVESLRESLQLYRDQARHIGYLDEIGPQLSRDVQVAVYRWGLLLVPQAEAAWLEQWSAFLKNHFNSNQEIIGVLNHGLSHLADELDKPCPLVACLGETYYLYREPSEILMGALTHIFRNCLDHGIESEMERIRVNKEPVGSITTEWFCEQQLILTITDDGRGLNLPKIRQRAMEKSLLPSDEDLDDTAIAELVFSQGFSTKDTVSSISGRGVGMDAVRASLSELQGSIQIVWTGPRNRYGFRPCAWHIILPLDLVVGKELAA